LDWERVPEPVQHQFFRMARTALEAMRNPPEKIYHAGIEAVRNERDSGRWSYHEAHISWRAMINASLD
jgi:hypothetical protein